MALRALSPTASGAERKRKHEDIIDLTGDENAADAKDYAKGDGLTSEMSKHRRTKDHEQSEEGADDENDDKSYFEDALDLIELEPYTPGVDNDGLSEAAVATLRVRLQKVGPKEFIEETVACSNAPIPPRILGTAFGMYPQMFEDDDESFLRLLDFAILRTFQKRQKLAQYNTVDDAADLIRKSRNIMIITGAGISTSLGIPDFRSEGTGFYEQVRELGYSEGEDVFDIGVFDENPSIFYSLAGELLPKGDRYSPTHAFIRLLQDKDRLQTNYTQNIDNLEELAGIDRARLIQCHGSFATATCRKCKTKVDGHQIFDDIRAKRVSRCKKCQDAIAALPAASTKHRSSKPRKHEWDDGDDSDDAYDIPEAGIMKPDITFFGEQLPDTFFNRLTERDVKNVDLVIVIGTSLKVAPVSEMPNYLPHEVPHIYISREPIEHVNFDIQLLGECDHVVIELCRRAGWDLRHEMIPEEFAVDVQPADSTGSRWMIMPAADAPIQSCNVSPGS